MEAAKCPSIDEWIKQLWDIYTMECYLATKKKKMLLFVTARMDVEGIMLSEISQRKRNNTQFQSYVESNEQIDIKSKTETDS